MPSKGHCKARLTGVVTAVPIENCSNETGTGNTLVSTLQACKTTLCKHGTMLIQRPDSLTQVLIQCLIGVNFTLLPTNSNKALFKDDVRLFLKVSIVL